MHFLCSSHYSRAFTTHPPTYPSSQTPTPHEFIPVTGNISLPIPFLPTNRKQRKKQKTNIKNDRKKRKIDVMRKRKREKKAKKKRRKKK